ncbi:cysteine-rich CWC family protein [Duganella sp. Leaf126]|uniref:cysteine-rich CWC family protein n=1 Tax=Duganella sp. Leaf126 TaxID=1736266 RepID=UPI0027D86334|nr:cysteine-rich CWC family protein [Duganella sp. Leaf126]
MASPVKKVQQFYSLRLRSSTHYRAIWWYFQRSSASLPATLIKTYMSTCTRCGAIFSCAMADPAPAAAGPATPCWCTYLPPAVPVPTSADAVGCWCPACLERHLEVLKAPRTP